jgi:type II pantothenate kinase
MQAALIALPVNVDTTGAKILDGDETSGSDQKDSRDIWLPNWVETVSHIAVDVSSQVQGDVGVVKVTNGRVVHDRLVGRSQKSSTSLEQPSLLVQVPSPTFPTRRHRLRSHRSC